MKDKWQKFHSSYSPIDISKANTGQAALAADWSRESAQGRMKINGIPIIEYVAKYNGFQKEENVESFFKEVILKDMTSANEIQKSQMIDFLKKTFHQGGYMYPVSSPIAVSIPGATVGEMDISINVVTTKTGFKIQEFTKIKDLLVFPDFMEKNNIDKFNPRIYPENGADYVIKAQGTINFDFSKSADKPTIEIESNTISYGHSIIKNTMDNRHLGQVIMDFFKNVLGLNQIKDISPETPSQKEKMGNTKQEQINNIAETSETEKENAPPTLAM